MNAHMQRPTPSGQPMDGYVYVPRPDHDPRWRLIGAGRKARRCRGSSTFGGRMCGAQAVAELKRPHVNQWRWWAYCPDHLYGRWVEDGQLMHWCVEKADTPGGVH